jgi:hypothetical protein
MTLSNIFEIIHLIGNLRKISVDNIKFDFQKISQGKNLTEKNLAKKT